MAKGTHLYLPFEISLEDSFFHFISALKTTSCCTERMILNLPFMVMGSQRMLRYVVHLFLFLIINIHTFSIGKNICCIMRCTITMRYFIFLQEIIAQAIALAANTHHMCAKLEKECSFMQPLVWGSQGRPFDMWQHFSAIKRAEENRFLLEFPTNPLLLDVVLVLH